MTASNQTNEGPRRLGRTRPFLPWSVLGGALWSVYTCALAYRVATRLAGYPLASLVISSLITSAALAVVYFVDRRRRRRAKTGEPVTPSSRRPDELSGPGASSRPSLSVGELRAGPEAAIAMGGWWERKPCASTRRSD